MPLSPVPTAPTSAPGTPAADGVRRLAAGAPVRIDDGLCLAYRLPAASGEHAQRCAACADACPTQALAFDGRSLQLRGDCLGCGQCRAACPTGAVWLPGFALAAAGAADAASASSPVRLDCWKGLPPDPGPDSSRRPLALPCLFGLPNVDWLELRARSLPRPLQVVDRGWCAGCAASGGRSLAQRIGQLNALLTAAGLPTTLHLALHPVPAGTMPARIADPVTRRVMGRRAFFAGLVRETVVPLAAPATVSGNTVRATIRRRPAAGDYRRRLIASLSALTRDFGGQTSQLPAVFFHRVNVDAACGNHGVCAVHCPTGALARWQETPDGAHLAAAASGLAFDSSACIGCGHCAAVCPEGALRLTRGAGYQTVTRLTTHATGHCASCGAELTVRRAQPADAHGAPGTDGTSAADDARLCDACFKSRRLARSAFQQLFGARG